MLARQGNRQALCLLWSDAGAWDHRGWDFRAFPLLALASYILSPAPPAIPPTIWLISSGGRPIGRIDPPEIGPRSYGEKE